MKIYKFQLYAIFSQKQQMVQRPIIPHFKGLVVDNKILKGKGCDSLKGLPCPFLLKSLLFYKQCTYSAPSYATDLSFYNHNAQYQTFKMRHCGHLYLLSFFRKLKESDKNGDRKSRIRLLLSISVEVHLDFLNIST